VRCASGVMGVVFGAGGCAGRAPSAGRAAQMPVVQMTACVLIAPPSTVADSLRIEVTDALDPRDVPVARTTAERLVFPQLFGAPARVANTGQGTPLTAGSGTV